MIITLQTYNRVENASLGAGLNLTGAKLALLADTYTFDAGHETWAEVSGHEIAGTGYTAGGKAMGGSITGGVYSVSGNLTTFTALEATFAYGVIVGGDDNLVACLTFSAGNSITVTGYDFEISWSEAGIIKAEET